MKEKRVLSDSAYKKHLLEQYPPDKFNWYALLLGVLYYAYHGMWGKALLYLILSPFTLFVGMWIYMGLKHNRHYLESKGIYVK